MVTRGYADCLAMGPGNLRVMTMYFNNTRAYELQNIKYQNRHIFSTMSWSRVLNLWSNVKVTQSYNVYN